MPGTLLTFSSGNGAWARHFRSLKFDIISDKYDLGVGVGRKGAASWEETEYASRPAITPAANTPIRSRFLVFPEL